MGPQLVPVIPTYTVIPRVIFGIPSPAHTFNPESRPNFALKSRVPSFKERKSRNQIKRQTYSLPSTHIDCVLHVYLCNGLNFLEIKLANPNTQNITDSRNIIHESARSQPTPSLRSQLQKPKTKL